MTVRRTPTVPTPSPTQQGLQIPAYAQWTVSGRALYLTTGDVVRGTLERFDRSTGERLGFVHLPAAPVDVVADPDGTVWVAFGPHAHESGGVRHYREDLSVFSQVDLGCCDRPTVLAPDGPQHAVVATDRGVLRVEAVVRDPVSKGRVVAREPLPLAAGEEPTQVAVGPAGGLYVLATAGGRTRVVVVGHGDPASYTPPLGQQAVGLAVTPDDVWVADEGVGGGHVVRLDGALRTVDGDPFGLGKERAGSLLLRSVGTTVWVADSRRGQLGCLNAARSLGPVWADVAATDLAVAQDIVYAGTPASVTVFPVPFDCA